MGMTTESWWQFKSTCFEYRGYRSAEGVGHAPIHSWASQHKGGARFGNGNRIKELRDKRQEILESVISLGQQNNGNLESGQVLLIDKIPVYGNQNIEIDLCPTQQIPIPETCPTGATDSSYLVPGDISGKFPTHAFIQQYPTR